VWLSRDDGAEEENPRHPLVNRLWIFAVSHCCNGSSLDVASMQKNKKIKNKNKKPFFFWENQSIMRVQILLLFFSQFSWNRNGRGDL
jgi:hypothetical protein